MMETNQEVVNRHVKEYLARHAALSEPAHEFTGAPICPRCGRHLLYEGPAHERIVVDRAYPVTCVSAECDWKGTHVRVRTVR